MAEHLLKGEAVTAYNQGGTKTGGGITNDNGETLITNQKAEKITIKSDRFPDLVKADATVIANQTVDCRLNYDTAATINVPILVTKKDGTTPIAGIIATWVLAGKPLKKSAATGADGKSAIVGCLPGDATKNVIQVSVAGKDYPIAVEIKTGMAEVKFVTDVEGDVGTIKVIAYLTIDGEQVEIPLC